jgi:hypothetical protein
VEEDISPLLRPDDLDETRLTEGFLRREHPLRRFALHGLWNFPGELGSFFSTSFTYQLSDSYVE